MATPSLLHDLHAYRFALQNLILKDFRIRYRNMSLGFLWSVVNPLIMLGVLVFIFTYVSPLQTIPYYPVYVLAGLIVFNGFSLCLTAATGSVVDNAPLIKKTIFPRVLLPFSVVLSQAIQVGIQWLLFGMFLLILRVPPALTWLWLPAIVGVELLFILGMSLICSALNVYFRDMQYVVASAMTLLFWFTPIFYSLSLVHDRLPFTFYGLYLLNPLAGCTDSVRKVILSGQSPDFVAFGFAVVIAGGLFLLGLSLFHRLQRNFADRL